MANLVELGSKIRAYRKERGLTSTALSKLACIRIETLSRIEAGLQKPSHKTLYNISKVLGVDFEYLIAS
jgi:transcriptional regulator with XRE-family HTH domain